MKRVSLALLLALTPLTNAAISNAEDVNQIFTKVNEYIAKKNYPKALTELEWARKEIEKANTAQLQSFFPNDLSGMKGSPIQANSALGMMNIERSYTGNGKTVKVSLLGGSGGGQANPLGGLAALGQMAAMFGGAQQGAGQESFRLDGRTANLNAEPGSQNSDLTVFLESGSMLKLESYDGVSGDTLKGMAQALKINDLDNYLKGNS